MSVKPGASRPLVLTAFLVLYVLWGSTYLAMRWAVEAMPPFLMSAARFFIAGMLMYGVLRLAGALRPTLRDWRHLGIIALCLMVGGNGGVCFGVQYISSGLAALLISTVPLWMILMAWLIDSGARPSRLVVAGLIFGFVGMFLLVWPNLHWERDLSINGLKGIGAVLLAALVWSGGSIYARRVQLSTSASLGLAMQMLMASFVLFLVAGMTRETSMFNYHLVTTRSLGAFLYLLVAAPVGFTAYLYLLKVCSPSLVTTYAFVNPVIAMGLGWAVAGESITSSMLTGAACLVVGVAMVILD